jgi:hypothetical protein
METFNDEGLTPEQVKMLTLQFMGQHLTGDLKSLEQNIVAKNNTLQGMVLDPAAVINSIPTVSTTVNQQPQLIVHQSSDTLTAATQPINNSPVQAVTLAEQPTVDQNQLEFSFETSPLSERIFESLERLEKRLSVIEKILLTLEDTKKKD